MSVRRALLAVCLACAPAHASPPASPQPPAGEPEGARPALNDAYRDPDDLNKWQHVFEQEGREVRDRKPDILVDLSLRPGMSVADVGAGTGLYTLDLARAVGPAGTVYAVDIIPHFLRHIEKKAARAGLKNIRLVQAGAGALNLPPASADLVFTCDVYHHLERPAATLAAIRAALRPGGTLVLVDLRRDADSPAWIFEHVRATRDQVVAEITAAGFSLVTDRTAALGLRDNYVLHFKPTDAPPRPANAEAPTPAP